MQTLILYSTSACHLCEIAMQMIEGAVQSRGHENLSVKVIDIASDDYLIERYGIRIPVVSLEGVDEDLGWPFDSDSLHVYLNTFRA